MKGTDLMPGNLVTFKDCQNDEKPPIIKILQINVDGEAIVSIDGSEVYDEIEINDEIVGIPLTDEILRENFPEPDEVTWFPRDGAFFCETTTTKDIMALGLFRHVHELQHCLKLVGIDKEIIL